MARRGKTTAAIKRADTEAIQIEGPRWEEKGDSKERDTEAIRTKGSQRQEKSDNK